MNELTTTDLPPRPDRVTHERDMANAELGSEIELAKAVDALGATS